MSERFKGQVNIEEAISHCKSLVERIGQLLEKAIRADDVEDVEHLQNEIPEHNLSAARALLEENKKRSPKIGDVVPVVRYEYDDIRGTFDEYHEKGTVTRTGAGGITLRVPEQIFPKRIIPERIIPKQIIAKKIIAEHFVTATWYELTEEWVDNNSVENWDDEL